jgi:hypothetical protein
MLHQQRAGFAGDGRHSRKKLLRLGQLVAEPSASCAASVSQMR